MLSMQNQRLAQLLEWLENEPNDPFLIYAVATEYKKNNPQKTLEYFEKLLREHEEYTGTYYHAAALYVALGKREEARVTYEKGMAICRRVGDRRFPARLQRRILQTIAFDDRCKSGSYSSSSSNSW